jgi:protein NrfC
MTEEEKKDPRAISRRLFLRGAGATVVGGAVGVVAGSQMVTPAAAADGGAVADAAAPTEVVVEKIVEKQVPMTFPASAGYLVVDNKKCAGCMSCMMACSMAHEGQPNPSLSRIQIVQDPFQRFPNDLMQYQCRQCATPLCVQNCPTGACHVDTANGNVRVIDQSKCIGCQTCINSCPQTPHRTIWNAEAKKSSKCDLCINAPYLGEQGGPTGKQACVSVCPMQAIKLVTDKPVQTETVGYNVNLRNEKAADIWLDVD